jgi:ribosomal protein S27E
MDPIEASMHTVNRYTTAPPGMDEIKVYCKRCANERIYNGQSLRLLDRARPGVPCEDCGRTN